MIELTHIIRGTPFYVWTLLTYLISVGIRSLKVRVVYLPKIFIMPLVLIVVKYQFSAGNFLVFGLSWITGAIAGFFKYADDKITIIKTRWLIEIPGSCATLIILILLFLTKYYFGYLKVVEPNLALKYLTAENTITGLFSGYFLGRTICYTYKYFKAQ